MYNNVNKGDIDKIVQTWDKAVIKFGAPWCAPCKTLDATLEALEREDLHIGIAKVNVDDEPELAATYGVMGVPTMVFFKNGEVVKTVVGPKHLRDITDIVEGL